MCKLVTRSTSDWPCGGGGYSRSRSDFDCSLGVCRLHPSLQGPDDRSRLFGLSRLYNCPGWNEVHQNWRERQKQRQDCLFRWSRFHPKWWVVFLHVRHLCDHAILTELRFFPPVQASAHSQPAPSTRTGSPRSSLTRCLWLRSEGEKKTHFY